MMLVISKNASISDRERYLEAIVGLASVGWIRFLRFDSWDFFLSKSRQPLQRPTFFLDPV